MDDNTKKHIFDPFFTTKRDKGGTGLGLSISYGIIREHKGRIDVESQVGIGTTLTIRIPVLPPASVK
jgi:signal transduction histidine kinase